MSNGPLKHSDFTLADFKLTDHHDASTIILYIYDWCMKLGKSCKLSTYRSGFIPLMKNINVPFNKEGRLYYWKLEPDTLKAILRKLTNCDETEINRIVEIAS